MVIHELSADDCLAALSRAGIGRLGCARDGQPYVVPISFAYDRAPDGTSYLYGFTTVGQKVEWMRANPQVCVEWDQIAALDRWVSVIALGRFEELTGDAGHGPPGRRPERAAGAADDSRPRADESEAGAALAWAQHLLQRDGSWWEPGAAAYMARKYRSAAPPFQAIYYRVRIDQVTGYRATPGPADRPT